MSQMLVNIKRVVDGVSNRTTQLDVIFEAITNSMHAHASHITCRLHGHQEVLSTEDGAVLAPKKVTAIEIEDDGDGFNDDNCSSFGRYRTDYKVDLGCKGIGRFVFLKVFDDVHYISHISALQKKRTFKFSFDFDSDNLQESDAEVISNKTILSLRSYPITPAMRNAINPAAN